MKHLLFFLLITATVSCGVKPGGTTSGNNLYETFYAGEQGTQYYIKPLGFAGKNSESMFIDFTFRYNNQVKNEDSAIVNMTIRTNQKIKVIDTLIISNGISTSKLSGFRHLYSEKEGSRFFTRFTVNYPVKFLVNDYNNSDWKITCISGEYKNEFDAENKTRKKIVKIKDRVFSLF